MVTTDEVLAYAADVFTRASADGRLREDQMASLRAAFPHYPDSVIEVWGDFFVTNVRMLAGSLGAGGEAGPRTSPVAAGIAVRALEAVADTAGEMRAFIEQAFASASVVALDHALERVKTVPAAAQVKVLSAGTAVLTEMVEHCTGETLAALDAHLRAAQTPAVPLAGARDLEPWMTDLLAHGGLPDAGADRSPDESRIWLIEKYISHDPAAIPVMAAATARRLTDSTAEFELWFSERLGVAFVSAPAGDRDRIVKRFTGESGSDAGVVVSSHWWGYHDLPVALDLVERGESYVRQATVTLGALGRKLQPANYLWVQPLLADIGMTRTMAIFTLGRELSAPSERAASLRRTLLVYLLHEADATRTAQHLGIHRNTVLNRTKEALGLLTAERGVVPEGASAAALDTRLTIILALRSLQTLM